MALLTEPRVRLLVGAALVTALSACAGNGLRKWPDASARTGTPSARSAQQGQRPSGSAAPASLRDDDFPSAADGEPAAAPLAGSVVREGSGRFVNPESAPYQVTVQPGGDIVLNFEDADIRQAAKVILGDLLGETYFVDPAVKGTVTLNNDEPLRRDALLPILEVLLQMNGAALVPGPSGFQILPMNKAPRQSAPPSAYRWPLPSTRGYSVQIIQLEFASAEEISKILEPFVPEGGSLRAVPDRNILILAAPGYTVEEFLQTVRVFDADWLAGMTMGMFPLTYADAATVVTELEQVLNPGGDSPMAGMVRLFPIERLNAVLVVTPQRRYLAEVRSWLEDLDRGGDAPGRRLYVYEVKNSKAEHIARVLTEVFLSPESDGAGSVGLPPPSLAPGLTPVTLSSSPAPQEEGVAGETPAAAPPAPALPPGVAAAAPDTSPLPDDLSSVRIIPDTVNNTLLVMATRTEYAAIEAAIRRLDILPRQVLVETTFAEVRLTNNLQYGVQWFIKGGLGDYGVEVRSVTGNSPDLPVAAAPGFSASVFRSPADVRLFISALEAESNVKVLSSPQLMVTDNQSASITVGTQVPVLTSSSTGGDTGGNVVQQVEYVDTGVLLNVTPHINAGGYVSMEVSQEDSVPGAPLPPSGNVQIDTRSIKTSISVQSGETIVLGGLIQERNTDGVTGVPVLSRIPVLGALFSERTEEANRTELIVLITPRVINNSEEAREVTRELRQRLRNASELHPG
jgi:general secretion pathway protein D